MKAAMLEMSYSAQFFKAFVQEMRKYFDFDWLITYPRLENYYIEHGFNPVLIDPTPLEQEFLRLSDNSLLTELAKLRHRFGLNSFRSVWNASIAYHSGSICTAYNDRQIWAHTLALCEALGKYLDAAKPDLVLQNYGAETDRRLLRMLCDERRIDTVFFEYIPFYHGFQPNKDEYSNCYNINLRHVSDETISQYLENYLSGKAVYFNSRPKLQITTEKLVKLLKNPDRCKIVSEYFCSSSRASLLRAKKNILDRVLGAKFRGFPKDRKILLYPVQQPVESTITVRSRGFSNQDFLIYHISQNMPEDFVLLVKFHPQVSNDISLRQIWNYSKLHNVYLLPSNMGTQDVLPSCDAVITVNSTVGFEALMMGLPVIAIGDSIYRGRGATLDVENIFDIGMLIDKARDFRPPPERVRLIIHEWLARAFRGWFDNGYDSLAADIHTFAELRSNKSH